MPSDQHGAHAEPSARDEGEHLLDVLVAGVARRCLEVEAK
jgi:hypothetical protein